MFTSRHADFMPLRHVLKQSYYMPNFQRGYAWDEEEVLELIADLEEGLKAETQADVPLGPLMTFEDEERRINVIDGQQRMTTIFLMILAARNIARENDNVFKSLTSLVHTAKHHSEKVEDDLHVQHPKGYIQSLFAWIYNTPGITHKDVHAEAVRTYREVNKDLFNGETARRVSIKKTEIGRIAKAYATCETWLLDCIGNNPDDYQDLVSLLFHEVFFLVILTRDDFDAQRQFERANSRGKPLNAFDLLKNTVIQSTPRNKRDQIENIWDDMQNLIERSQTKPDNMMRAAYIAGMPHSVYRDTTTISARNWFRAKEQLAVIQSDPVSFAENLKRLWALDENMRLGLDPRGEPCHSISVMVGLMARLDFLRPIYFAAHKAPSDLFHRIMVAVETVTATAYITGMISRDYQNTLLPWVRCLSEVRTSEDVDYFIANHVNPFLRQKRSQVRRDIESMPEPKSKPTTLVLLKKASAHFEQKFGFSTKTEGARFADYDDFQIEHIRPRKGKKRSDDMSDPIFMLGNLCLLEISLNASIQDKEFEEKKQAYDLSTCRLTKQIVRSQSFGNQTAFGAAATSAPVFSTWKDADIARRQSFMADLLMEAWMLDDLDRL